MDIEVKPVIHVYPHGHNRRLVFLGLPPERARSGSEQDLITESEFDELAAEVKEHLDCPDTLVVSHLFFQVWGRKPI